VAVPLQERFLRYRFVVSGEAELRAEPRCFKRFKMLNGEHARRRFGAKRQKEMTRQKQ
jgi:hypothetical protein